MPRTERQIAEYMMYYNNTTDRATALEALARVEKKTPAEIRAICEKYAGMVSKQGMPVPKEIKNEIKNCIEDGIGDNEIMARYKISKSTLQKLHNEVKTELNKAFSEKFVEPFNDYEPSEPDAPAPVVEEDVRVFLPGDPGKIAPPAGHMAAACSVWFAIRDQITEFLVGTFGAGTEPVSESADTFSRRATVRVKTADNKIIRCTIKEEEIDNE